MKTSLIIKKLKLKTLAGLLKKAKANETLSPTDLKMLKELEQEFGGGQKEEEVFESRAEALKELKAQGYKVGKSKFYQDCGHGICKVEKDGSITTGSLNKYIKHPRANLKRLDKIREEEISKEKTNAEIEKLRTQVEILKHDLAVKTSKYISREDFEMELCSRWVAHKTAIDYMIESRAAEWVLSAFGAYNQEYARLLRECVQADFDDNFNQFARMEQFEVEIGEK